MKLFLCLFLATCGCASFSTTRPIQISWRDGRQAEVQIVESALEVSDVPFQVLENLCNSHVSMKCDLHLHNYVATLKLIWVKNPDSKRIGNIVEFQPVGNQGYVEVAFDQLVDGTEKDIAPRAYKGLSDDTITCSDYSWLPEGSVDHPPKEALIKNWVNEFTFKNAETGESENHLETELFDVRVRRTEKGDIVLHREGPQATTNPTLTTAVGQTTSVFFQREASGPLCQVTLKMDYGAILDDVTKAAKIGRAKPASTYITGRDELFTLNKNFRTLLENLKESTVR